MLPLFKQLLGVFLAQSVYDAKSETHSFADPHLNLLPGKGEADAKRR